MFIKKDEKKKIKEQVELLKHELEDLKEVVKTQELFKLRAENTKLRERNKLITHVHLKVKTYAYDPDNNCFIVRYEIDPVVVNFNADGGTVLNDAFYAINALQLTSFEDMEKVKSALQRAKDLQKKI